MAWPASKKVDSEAGQKRKREELPDSEDKEMRDYHMHAPVQHASVLPATNLPHPVPPVPATAVGPAPAPIDNAPRPPRLARGQLHPMDRPAPHWMKQLWEK